MLKITTSVLQQLYSTPGKNTLKDTMIPEKKMIQYFHNFLIAAKIRYTWHLHKQEWISTAPTASSRIISLSHQVPICFRGQSQEGLGIFLAHSTYTAPTFKTGRLLLSLTHHIHPAPLWQWHTKVAPCIRTGLKQEVTQLFSCTHLVICLLQQHGAVFSCLPAKSIFCSHSWEPYRWYRSLLPGVQSVFLLGCTLCL